MFNEVLESTLEILRNELWKAFYETAIMLSISFFLSTAFGLSFGFLLYLTRDQRFFKRPGLNKVIAAVINFIRSVAASVPLSITATVFLARLVESSLKEVDSGVLEAALSTGAKTSLIVRKVLLREAAPGIVRGITVTFISLIGFSAMAGMVGGGGIGNLAVQYGYYRYELGIMIFTIVVLVLLVQAAQFTGDYIAKKLTH